MALCVSPPPHGFSQARCSSKILTLCPARASCSPHIAPEGPPPTIAISAMLVSRCEPRIPFPVAEPRPKGPSGDRPLGDGENHQAKTSLNYSTEQRRRRRRSGFITHYVHGAPLYHIEQCHVHREQAHQDFSAVQKEHSHHKRSPDDESQRKS